MAAKKTRSFVKLVLLEQNEGKFAKTELLIDSEDIDEVKRALAGRGLGVMGCDPEDSCYKLVRLSSLESIMRRYPKRRVPSLREGSKPKRNPRKKA